MVDAMIAEMALRKEFLPDPLASIYFGGGTPSLLSEEAMIRLMEAIQTHFRVVKDPEITLEANPDDLMQGKVRTLRTAGINRLSIGIQSFDDAMLRFLNRAHNSTAAYRCLHLAREEGINNISLDLIYAIPGLSLEQWRETVRKALQFKPEHISSYGLTVEEKTVFGNWKKTGKLLLVDDHDAASQFESLMEIMDDSEYTHYEISNFCRPGFYARHNSSYWKQEPYLGIGPSAHSYNGSSRQFNIRNNALYVKSIAAGIVPSETELLTRENMINEYLLTGLRTQWGCNLNHLRETWNEDLTARCGTQLSQLIDQGFLVINQSTLVLTRKGKLLADKITADLMI